MIFGDTTTNRLASSVDSTYYRISNTVVPAPGTPPGTTRKIWRNTLTVGATLPAGTYWIDWASTITAGANHFDPTKTIAGSRGSAGDNGTGLTVSTGNWADIYDTGNPASAPDVPQDFPYDINGSPAIGTPTPTPTPTLATVDGRVLTSDGRGLRNATVSITDPLSIVRTATTSSFGFYSFDNVTSGGTYTIRVSSRLFRFVPLTMQIDGNLTLPDFVGFG